jgi:hypothetical protein
MGASFSRNLFVYVSILFVGMLAAVELGRALGARYRQLWGGDPEKGIGVIETGTFALLGLLVSFAFYGAATRFDARRTQIVDEANAIETAYLRIDALPGDSQAALREDFRRYVESRLRTYRLLPSKEAALTELARSQTIQGSIWRHAVASCQRADAHPGACILVLPSLNTSFDLANSRTMSVELHPPLVIFGLLFGVAIASAFIAGYAMAISDRRRWMHIALFSVLFAGSMYVILDLEYPRLGYVQETAFDRALEQVRAHMQ